MSPAQMFAMKVQPLHARPRRRAGARCGRSRWRRYAHAQNNPRAVMYGRPLDDATVRRVALDRRAVPPVRLLPGERRRRRDGAGRRPSGPSDFDHPPCYVLAAVSGSQHRAGAPVHNTPEYASSSFTTVAPRLYDMAQVGAGRRRRAAELRELHRRRDDEHRRARLLQAATRSTTSSPSKNLLAPSGKLPLNTSGGNLAECYMHGLGLNIEAVRQIWGQSTRRCPAPTSRWCAPGPMVTPVSSSIFGSEATL